MLDLIKKVRDHLLSDSTITDLVEERVYWEFSPKGNTSADFPQVTLTATDGSTDTVRDVYQSTLMVHIWTKGDGKATSANEIAKRILIRLDSKSFLSTEPYIYQVWKTSGADLFEDSTQTLHKILIFDVVIGSYEE